MEFLNTLLIIIAILLAIRLILKFYGRRILMWAGKKAGEKMVKEARKRYGGASSGADEGTKSRSRTRSQNLNKSKSSREEKVVGEYIDYEEID